MDVIAIFGPTGVGKTSVAIELARLLRAAGEDPVAVGCDAMQVYRGLDLISAAPTAAERAELEHRLVGLVDPGEEFSAGRFAELAQTEIDGLLAAGRRPIVVGGTGLYLRAALSELELRPPVPEAIRAEVEAELERRGSAALQAELPVEQRANVHANDRKKIVRYTELLWAGLEPPRGSEQLWTASLRLPTLLAGLTMEREPLVARIDARIEAMVAAGAVEVARAARERGLSATAAKMIGLEAFAAGDVERARLEHRRYARRQLTWMRKMRGVEIHDLTGRCPGEIAGAILG
jgi:tRNA dimethylallyltransferase